MARWKAVVISFSTSYPTFIYQKLTQANLFKLWAEAVFIHRIFLRILKKSVFKQRKRLDRLEMLRIKVISS